MKGTDIIFPYHLFHRGDKVLVCGSLSVGKEFQSQIRESGYIEILHVITQKELERIWLVEEYDAILIAVLDRTLALEIRNRLISFGVLPEKIKWDGDSYCISGLIELYTTLLDMHYPENQFDSSSSRRVCNISKKILNMDDFVQNDLEYGPLSTIVDVVIPIYNAYEYTKVCVERVLENTTSPYNLYLINDGSTDSRIHDLLLHYKNKRLSNNLCSLSVIEHENLGYLKSVNEVMRATKSHLVLLNSDTEVPRNWLQRLIQPMLSNGNIASVIPTTNASSLCSFPINGSDNPLLYECSSKEIDKAFSFLSGKQLLELPCGVGFCMAMNRNALNEVGYFDEAFGLGYGEETDWSLRASKQGWRNMWALNVFVYHKHGVSFNEAPIDRDKYRANARLIVSNRYPQYEKNIKSFADSKQWKFSYEWVACLLRIWKSEKKSIVYFDIKNGIPCKEGIIVMRFIDGNNVLLWKIFHSNLWTEFRFSVGRNVLNNIEKLFKIFCVDWFVTPSGKVSVQDDMMHILQILRSYVKKK